MLIDEAVGFTGIRSWSTGDKTNKSIAQHATYSTNQGYAWPRRWIIVSKKYTWCSDRVTLSGLQDARIRKLTSQAESDDGESYGECKMTTAQSCLQSTDSSDEGWVTDNPTSIFTYACFWNCSFGFTKSDSIKSCKTVSRVCLRYTLHFNIVRKELGL